MDDHVLDLIKAIQKLKRLEGVVINDKAIWKEYRDADNTRRRRLINILMRTYKEYQPNREKMMAAKRNMNKRRGNALKK